MLLKTGVLEAFENETTDRTAPFQPGQKYCDCRKSPPVFAIDYQRDGDRGQEGEAEDDSEKNQAKNPHDGSQQEHSPPKRPKGFQI